jgi:tRNA dimethylallyltransferase
VPEHLALIGPTASGKSDLALRLAEALGDIEIVAIDALQVYRGMDIGTAKPSPVDQRRVPHHCIDLIDPAETYSAADFQRIARAAIADIEARGNRALLVAGTGLYLRAVIDDFTFPAEDLELRAHLEALTETPEGLARAFAELQEADPVAASRMDPGNQRRVVRALEVMALTGAPFSEAGPGVDQYGEPTIPIRMLGLAVDADRLRDRIDARVRAMRDGGFLEEVQWLAGQELSRTARIAIGYAELLAYLDGTQPDLDEAYRQTVYRTRRYARRQRAWYGRDPRIRWCDTDGNADSVYLELLAHCGATSIEA